MAQLSEAAQQRQEINPGHPQSKPTVLPKTPAKEMVFVWPHLLSIEAIAAMLTLFALSLMSAFVNAPLLGLANPERTPNPAKAPWYFLGLQELLLHMHPALAGVIVPTVVLIGLAAMPYIDRDKRGTGIWFSTRKGVAIAWFSAIYTWVWEITLIIFDEFFQRVCLAPKEAGCDKWATSFSFSFTRTVEGAPHGIAPWFKMFIGEVAWPTASPDVVNAIADVVVPSVIMLFIPWLLVKLVKRRYNANTREIMISLFSFFLASFIVLTITSTAFRGHSMKLMWPWEVTPPE